MQITYQLSESEFTYDFFKKLKKTFKGKNKVEFSVNIEENPFRISKDAFEEMVLGNEKSENQYVFEGNEFEIFTEKILKGENVDFENYKRSLQK